MGQVGGIRTITQRYLPDTAAYKNSGLEAISKPLSRNIYYLFRRTFLTCLNSGFFICRWASLKDILFMLIERSDGLSTKTALHFIRRQSTEISVLKYIDFIT